VLQRTEATITTHGLKRRDKNMLGIFFRGQRVVADNRRVRVGVKTKNDLSFCGLGRRLPPDSFNQQSIFKIEEEGEGPDGCLDLMAGPILWGLD